MADEAQPDQDLSALLAFTPLPSEVVEFSRTDGMVRKIARVRVRVLSMAALDLARGKAFRRMVERQKFTVDQLQEPIPLAMQQDAVAREVLVQACCSVNPIPQPVHLEDRPPQYAQTFRDPEQLSNWLSAEDLKFLWAHYCRIARDSAPVFVDEDGPEPVYTFGPNGETVLAGYANEEDGNATPD